MTPVPSKIRKAEKHLRPIIEERYRMREQFGPDYEGKPVRGTFSFTLLVDSKLRFRMTC